MNSKVFIVTGASRGIGAAIARYLLGRSHKVVVTARSQEPLEGLKKSHPNQVEFIAADIVEPQLATKLVDLAVSSFGQVDGLVVNHGVLVPKKFADTTLDEWKKIYDINLFSGVALTQAQAALNELRKSKGCIVWVSSGAASKQYAAWSSYGSSKAAYNSISAHIALEEPDITSVAIAPGRVDTEMQGVLRSQGKGSMSKAQYDSFVEAKEKGILLQPEQPGHVMAKFVADPLKDLSGKSFSWNSPEVATYQE
ncbi:hypothetical protein F66182_76 [Fusarium sp. NRRL 66182]|nr:hypothetical protein F66182_76 [Fusarium sp. NRRL 66182]